MKRVKVLFAGREVDFVNREIAIKWVEELAERGTHKVFVIYGPEGCGKTAFFKQAAEVLREHDYSVVHVNPIASNAAEKLIVTDELKGLIKDALSMIPDPYGSASRLIDFAIELLYMAVRRSVRRRIALLADDVFQAIGLDKAEVLVKSFLNMIEWPSIRYEKIVVLVASSEGVTRARVGRHRWADLFIMWNMGKEGLKQLYDKLPGDKPSFEDVWRWTGGNPEMLENLCISGWDPNKVINLLVAKKDLTGFISSLSDHEKEILEQAVYDPDILMKKMRYAERLVNMLTELNLIIRVFEMREPYLWIDAPAPRKDAELGIGEYYAWQTPLHREAVRKTLRRIE